MANSVFIWPGVSSSSGGAASFAGAVTSGGAGNTTGSFYAADGTAPLPAYSFTSEPTLGFWRSGAGTMRLEGAFTATGTITGANLSTGTTGFLLFGANGLMRSSSNGIFKLNLANETIGSTIKVDALPTIASGGGGTVAAAITAGSTPLAGSVNVGTGVITSPIVINFNGTAFPSAPFAVCTDGQTAIAVRATASTTQLTLTSAAFVANDVISWHCISAK